MLNYSNFKKRRSEGGKKSKAFYSTQKTFKQESALATDKLGERNSVRLVPRVEGFTEQSWEGCDVTPSSSTLQLPR